MHYQYTLVNSSSVTRLATVNEYIHSMVSLWRPHVSPIMLMSSLTVHSYVNLLFTEVTTINLNKAVLELVQLARVVYLYGGSSIVA